MLRFVFFLFAVLLMAAPVWAQSSYELGNRIKRLENEIETLSRAVYRGEAPPPGSVSSGRGSVGADVEIRLQQIERELRELRGLVEEQSHEVSRIRSDMERITSDLELRVNALEGGAGGHDSGGNGRMSYTTGGGVSVPPSSPARNQDGSYQWNSSKNSSEQNGSLGSYIKPSPPGGGGDPAASAYEDAFALIKASRYGEAEKAFSDFLERYPGHVLAGNAKYWLGESYYVRGHYEQAARIFAEGYQQYPQGPKAADNLLKLGMSLAGLGKTDDACIALGQLAKENLAGSGPVMRRAEQERTRLNCQ